MSANIEIAPRYSQKNKNKNKKALRQGMIHYYYCENKNIYSSEEHIK